MCSEPILISPEIYIEKLDEDDDEYVIYFGDDGSPRLRVSQQYQQMLGKTDVSNETKSFIREKMRSAVDLLRNIEHRRQTIYKVVESIVHRQQDFLDKGVQYIKPMMLKDIAEGKALGDTTTLADPSVVAKLKEDYEEEGT